ncbi:hypothetical protein B0A48_07948 [Cryoendolithus antarcticus]|uniref:Endosomal peripheral membrane protein n=1 Tax=Cryoendolithus antarcticus TaxID=1507870 RepID=A0A1V8T0S6_9PEZI|nr:hypothetical protein B0A48_07948 [Cryoendolithus antarcticus]
MTATFLTSELSHLISESKRKNNDIRTTAEKSLQDLKALSITSEKQLAADLSRKPSFIEPFLLACSTHSTKYAVSGVTCLQKLIIARGLPKGRLQDAVQALDSCADLGLEVQFKILQALPSLVQNYADDLYGDLLGSTLQVCASLQATKVRTVSGVAAATLQQLLASVFEKVNEEDATNDAESPTTEVPSEDGPVAVRPVALDAYRILRDLALAADDRPTKFVNFTALSRGAILDLIASLIRANPGLIEKHVQLGSVVRSNVLPFAVQVLSERQSFAPTVRCVRLLDMILRRHFSMFSGECEIMLGLITHELDTDGAEPWRRCLYMEILSNFFADAELLVTAYIKFDFATNGKTIAQDILNLFVRMSTEKPAVIGLGSQSTIPSDPTASSDSGSQQAAMEAAGGVVGLISSALGVVETAPTGIGINWSIPRSPCMDQLDKTEGPVLPESYVYSLLLECVNSLSDTLARTILPLTAHHDRDNVTAAGAVSANGTRPSKRLGRSQSYRKRTVPRNPLSSEVDVSQTARALAHLIDHAWPAFLATCSTFLNAALDDHYYRNLIKAYQRFAQVAGLLRLTTSRDALITTLGKAAVPPQVLNSATSASIRSPTVESPRVFSNPKSLLSVDSLISGTSSISGDRERRSSTNPTRPTLTTRNLLCLRALLNLAIALGPTLGSTFVVVVDVLKQADIVLSVTSPEQLSRTGQSNNSTESATAVQIFSAEVAAVESAASRLLESTADYPNEAFLGVMIIFCRLLEGRKSSPIASPYLEPSSPPETPISPSLPRRTFSGLPGLSAVAEMQLRDYQFVIPKLGTLAALNIPRFISGSVEETGWMQLIDVLCGVVVTNDSPSSARRAAVDVLCRLISECIAEVASDEAEARGVIQRRSLTVLLQIAEGIYIENGELTNTDVDVHLHVLATLKDVVDRSGETLTAGWEQVLGVIRTTFENDIAPAHTQDGDNALTPWDLVSTELVSARLGQPAFDVLRCVCSDLLGTLPLACGSSVVELLYRFMLQPGDLNLSLATLSNVWPLSDILRVGSLSDDLERFGTPSGVVDPIELRTQAILRDSRSAQWFLLLLRLREVVHRGQLEVRKAALQTLSSICQRCTSELSPRAFAVVLQEIFVAMLADGIVPHGSKTTVDSDKADVEIFGAIVNNTFTLMSQNVQTVQRIPDLAAVWREIAHLLDVALKRGTYAVHKVIDQNLSMLLSSIQPGNNAWDPVLEAAFAIWADRTTESALLDTRHQDQQPAFVAYADLAAQLSRLLGKALTIEQCKAIMGKLYLCLESSHASYYKADTHAMSPLQGKVIDALRELLSMRSEVRPDILRICSDLLLLHHRSMASDQQARKPSFLALTGEVIPWLQQMIVDDLQTTTSTHPDACITAITALADIIVAKYAFTLQYKDLMLWQTASSSALVLAEPMIKYADAPGTNTGDTTALWQQYLRIIDGVVGANALAQFDDRDRIYDDEEADIATFNALQQVLTPKLSNPKLPDTFREQYAKSLFDASIIHATERGELPAPGESPLSGIANIRRGRADEVPYALRERMSYVCFNQLIRLSSPSDSASANHEKLAQATAPWLILRLAISIRAYIADQPLRGSWPQPLSELEELLFCFEQIGKLELHPEAIQQSKTSGGKAHLPYLYPLLVKALRVSGGEWYGAAEVREPLQKLLEELDVYG